MLRALTRARVDAAWPQFCEWVEYAEKVAHTKQGVDLGVNEPLEIAAASGRKWHTSPLEMRAANKTRSRQTAGSY